MEIINQGLFLSAVGISVTFAALGVMILVILILKNLFPSKNTAIRPANKEPHVKAELERSIAIIAATWYWQTRSSKKHPPELGELLAHSLRKPRVHLSGIKSRKK